jgi:hypothetical protein
VLAKFDATTARDEALTERLVELFKANNEEVITAP